MIITETNRLRIREFKSRDISSLSRVLSSPEVMEFSSNGPLNEQQVTDFIQWCSQSYSENGFGQWAVTNKDSGQLMGCCGLSRVMIDSSEEVEIGYRLAKAEWGKGLATEAAQAVLSYGFRKLEMDSVVGIVSTRHHASIRVLEKLGFKTYSRTIYKGWDVHLYRLRKSDWESICFSSGLQ